MKRTSSGLTRRRLIALSAAGTGALLLPGGFSGVGWADADPYAPLRGAWSAYLTGGAIDPSEAVYAPALTGLNNLTAAYLSDLQSASQTGSLWPDMPLGKVSANITSIFKRLRTMALAYATPGTAYTGSASLSSTIRDGLDFMLAGPYAPTNAQYNNWWDWQIGSTQALEDTAILLYPQLSASEIANCWASIKAFVPNPGLMNVAGNVQTATGANLLDLCRAWIVAGALTENSDTISTAVAAISSALPFVLSGDGLYPDYSFAFHSGVAYTGTYGSIEFADLAALALLLNGSQWMITDPNLHTFTEAVTEGYAPFVYNGLMMDSVRGRAISRYNESDAGDGFTAAINLLLWAQATSDPAQAAAWRATAKGWLRRNTVTNVTATTSTITNYNTGASVTTSAVSLASIALAESVLNNSSVAAAPEPLAHKQFPNMARVVHRRPGWAYSIAMSSDVVKRFEVTNAENLHGWYTGDGMGYLYLDADVAQFNDAFWDTVDAYRMPGTTADSGTLANSAGQATFPATKWVGGSVLNGAYGAVGMQLRAYSTNLAGVKSWFCLDDAVVCVGAGITSTSGNDVVTTVENRNLHAVGKNALYIDGVKRPISAGWSETRERLTTACLAGVAGYYFPQQLDGADPVRFALTDRTGNWTDVNALAPTTLPSDTRPYLSIAVDHGANPNAATYAYVILPNATERQTATYAASRPVRIVSNTAVVQAIEDRRVGVTMANFFAAGTAGPVTVNAPASVSVQESHGGLTIAVSDPTWTSPTVEVEVAMCGFGSVVSVSEGLTVLSTDRGVVRLVAETGGSRGATFTAVLRDGASRAASRATQLTATDSTYVRGGTPYSTQNFGGQSLMVVRNGVDAADEVSLLKFDTSTVTGSVKRAVLWLNGRVAGAAGSQTQLAAYALSSSAWSEGAITYATAPSLAAELGSGTISSLADWVGLDVTEAFVGGAASGEAAAVGEAGAVAAFGVRGVPGGLAVNLNTAHAASGVPVLEIIAS